MDIAEPVEKVAALHVDAVENAKIVVEAEVHTNSDSLKRRHSVDLKPDHENEPKKPKTSNNGENAEEDDDDDLIAKLDAIDAPVAGKETKPADLLKKLEEDGKTDDLLERMECIVEGKTPSNSSRSQDTDEKLDEVTKAEEKVNDEAKKSPEKPQKPIEAKPVAKEEAKPKEEPKKEEVKKDLPKTVEVRKEEPKPEKKVDQVEKMEVDGQEPPVKKVLEKSDENVISSTTENAGEAKNVPKASLNIPAKTEVTGEVSSMGDTKEKKDVKVPMKEEEKVKVKTPEKSEPAKEKVVQEKKDTNTEALPVSKSSEEKLAESTKASKQHNGLITSTDSANTTSDEEKDVKMESADTKTPSMDTEAISNGKEAESSVKENVYEVNYSFEENDIKFLYINKLDKDGGDKSEKEDDKFAVPTQSKNTVTFTGISSLCSFIVDHMRKLSPEEEEEESDDDKRGKKKGKSSGTKSAVSTPKSQKVTPVATKASGSSRRVSSKASTPVTTKSSPAPKADQEGKVGYCVMARWVDKMYYAGRVSAEKSGGKYVIHFEDGALKTLNRDLIVFGHENLMPFLDQPVHALVEGDTYEPGLVTEVTMDQNDEILYTVVTDSKTVVRTASDIYLEEDQAKSIQAAIKKDPQTGLVDLSAVKRVRRSSSASESEVSGRKKATAGRKEAEAGFSGGDAKKGRRGKRVEVPPPMAILNESQSSDISDIPDTETVPQSPECSALEAIDGVQPEVQKTSKEIDRTRRGHFDEYLKNGQSLEEILGPVPTSRNLFRNKCFILTVTFEARFSQIPDYEGEINGGSLPNRVPFMKDHIQRQIEAGGGKVYDHWEDVPKTKYSKCKLIAPYPCTTAKYVQCLATGINALSHKWIIECCKSGKTLEMQNFILPSGWSIIEKRYIKPVVKRVSSASKAFVDLNIRLTSRNKDFMDFWGRVCKLAGAASVQNVKSVNDISTIQNGFLLVGENVDPVLIEKAKDFNISVVSTVWVVQSLITGTCCSADAHESLTKLFTDDC